MHFPAYALLVVAGLHFDGTFAGVLFWVGVAGLATLKATR